MPQRPLSLRVTRRLASILCLAGFLYGEDGAARLEAAQQAFQRGELHIAERLLNTILAEHPNDALAYALLGSVLDAGKQYPQAGAAYRRAMQLSPPSATLLNNYAGHQLAVGDKIGARTTYLRAIELEPGNVESILELARLALDDKNVPEAMKYVARLSEADRRSQNVQAFLSRAQSLTDKKDAHP